MGQNQVVTVQNVCQILLKKKLISQEQFQMIISRADSQGARLHSHQQAGYSRRFFQQPEQISPAEVISSFNLEIPDSSKILTEDAITETMHAVAGQHGPATRTV